MKSKIRTVYQALTNIIVCLNKKQETNAIFLDLSKTFDNVDPLGLLQKKLKKSGIAEAQLKLIHSYLECGT